MSKKRVLMAKVSEDFHGEVKKFAQINGVNIQELITLGLNEITTPGKYQIKREVILRAIKNQAA